MDGNSDTVLTIGHPDHTLELFLDLLARHRVTAVADVRSAPRGLSTSHFNREPLVALLEAPGISIHV